MAPLADAAPSTALRAVPLPRFAREDRTRQPSRSARPPPHGEGGDRRAGRWWGPGKAAGAGCPTSSSSAAAITASSRRPISPRPASRSRCSSAAAQVGGAAVTEEFHPGFRNSVAAYTVSLLNPKVIRDLDLARPWPQDRRAPAVEFPAPARRALSEGRPGPDEGGGRQILRPRRRAARVLRGAARTPGRRLARARAQDAAEPRDRTGARRQSRRPRSTPPRSEIACVRSGSKGSAISSSSSPVRPATFSTNGSRATRSRRCSASTGSSGPTPAPTRAGTAYVLLHHCWGEVNGRRGVWGHAIGGMGAITQAMARACAARGVDIRIEAARSARS